MDKTKYIIYLIIALIISSFQKDKSPKIKFSSWISLKVPEPSDIAVAPNDETYFVVSDDDATVYEIDESGKILRKSKTLGIDLEAVCARPDFLYVVDETPRKIYQLNYSNLEVNRTFHVPYSGGRNKGYESITYNEKKNCFVLITEKDPINIIELDHDFRQINELRWKNARDISSATFHNGFVYFLSDEDMTIFKCNPENYEVISQWKINVHNPEGLAYHKGRILVIADDLERLYYFSQP